MQTIKKRKMLRACLSLFRIRFAEFLQYRLSALSNVSIGIFWAFIEIVVYTVFFTYADNRAAVVGGMTLTQVVSYTWVAQALVALQPMNVDGEILNQITNGDVGIELCRPLDLYSHWFAKTAAGRLGAFWLRGPLILLCGIVIPGAYGMGLPASVGAFCMFLLSAAAAFLLCTAYGMLITAVRLGITWGEGPTYIMLLIPGVLSGGYLPLPLWPDALQKILLYQPFSGYLDIPARLYTGVMGYAQGGGMILMQLLWMALFVLCGKLVMRRKLRTLIVQGG